MAPLTQKQINVLKVLADKRSLPVCAPWNHADLNALRAQNLAQNTGAMQASGKLSSNSIWTITEAGRRFLDVEREGR